jgi:uncharacterized RDD family membrane protein YckC
LKTATVLVRVKAFIVDMFMVMIPILYISTYLILNGADDFKSSDLSRAIIAFIYGAILVLFWVKTGQTPGYRAYDIKVVDAKTYKNITLLQGVVRYLSFLVSGATLLLLFLPLFRKDSKSAYDIASRTIVVTTSK